MIRLLLAGWDFAYGIWSGWWATRFAYLRLGASGAHVGASLRVRGRLDLHIHRAAVVSLGPDCRLKSGFAENAVGGYRRLGIWVGRQGRLTIGRGVGISSSTIVCMHSITIEDEVYIGGDCNIYDTDFHSITPEARLARPDTSVKTAPVIIRERSFIGGHSIILKGVTIGQYAVIGAGSVVTKDVPSGEIWAGNPARCVGRVYPTATPSGEGASP